MAPSPEFVGLENYTDLFTDPNFGQVMMNTLIFTGVSVVGSIIGGLLLGSLLATKVPLTGFAQTMAFAPHMLPGAAVGILWLFMFDPNYGLSRWAFSLLGADSPDWTTTSDWSLWAITIAYTWQRLGFVTVICYTAILDLPKDLYEAAALDGAHGWKLFRNLTLPLLSPITFFLSITGIISAAQAFDIISIMTSGGPWGHPSTLELDGLRGGLPEVRHRLRVRGRHRAARDPAGHHLPAGPRRREEGELLLMSALTLENQKLSGAAGSPSGTVDAAGGGPRANRGRRRGPRRPLWLRVLLILAVLGTIAMFLIPLYWLFSSSLKPAREIYYPGRCSGSPPR